MTISPFGQLSPVVDVSTVVSTEGRRRCVKPLPRLYVFWVVLPAASHFTDHFYVA
jgi:hypothetical protein